MSPSLDALKLDTPRPWIMAHRGASDLAPENTLQSFALALEHGADLLETDLWLSADGEPVCHHDATLRRTTKDPRRIGQLSAAQLGRLRVRDEHGRGGTEGIPRLTELLEAVPLSVPIMLEIKDPLIAQPRPLARLLDVLADKIRIRRVGVLCFQHRLLRRMKAAAPQLITGHIAMRDALGARDMDMLGPWWPLLRLNPRYVEAAHRRGQRVCPLDPHIQDPAHLRRWLDLDVDAVLTNDPRRTRRAIETLRGHNPNIEDS